MRDRCIAGFARPCASVAGTSPPPGATDVGFPSSSATGTATSTPATGAGRTSPRPGGYKAGTRAPSSAQHAMVASDAPLASQAGVEILQKGGNAVDAAVAVGFAIAVVFPEAGNIGGGGYMVIRMADGRTAALDYREIAPLAATRDMYLDAKGNLTDKSVVGPLASGVPGAVAGLTEALAKYGTMSLADVMAPAIRYAEEGFVVDSAQARSYREQRAAARAVRRRRRLSARAASRSPSGTRLVQPAARRDAASHRATGRAPASTPARRREPSPTR